MIDEKEIQEIKERILNDRETGAPCALISDKEFDDMVATLSAALKVVREAKEYCDVKNGRSRMALEEALSPFQENPEKGAGE